MKGEFCLERDPSRPGHRCFNAKGHDGEHDWWYCNAQGGGYPGIDCELEAGHQGDHVAHWK